MATDRHSPFLDRLDAEARELLMSVARPVSFLAGSRLMRHGEPARGAYVLRAGSAEAVVVLPGGESLTVALLPAGSFFGEMALFEHGTCTATVSATGNLDGWFVEREDFRALVAQRHPAALRIQHAITLVLSHKLRVLNQRVLACASAEDLPARAQDPAVAPLAGVPRLKAAGFDWRAFLPRMPLFADFDQDEIDDVAATGMLVERARADALFLAGQSADACFLVVRGAVEVVAVHNRMEKRLAVLGPGQLLGFMSMLEGDSHTVSAYAREAALILELPRIRFDALYMNSSPATVKLHRVIHASLLGSMAQTNRRLTRLISQERLAAAGGQSEALAAAYHAQIVAASG